MLPRHAPRRASWAFSPCSPLWPSPLALQSLGRGATWWGPAIPAAPLPGGPLSALFWAVRGGRRLRFGGPLFPSHLSPSLLSTPFLCPCPDVCPGPSPVLLLLCVSCVPSQVFICLCLHASSLVCLSLSHSSKHHSLAVGWGWAGEQNVPPGRAPGTTPKRVLPEPGTLCALP